MYGTAVQLKIAELFLLFKKRQSETLIIHGHESIHCLWNQIMRILLIGSGGREHALYEQLIKSPIVEEVKVLPGNGGIDPADLLTNLSFDDNFSAIKDYVVSANIDLVVVGPEQPLVDGITDALENHCLVFGPKKAAAQIEGSKSWARDFMARHDIPSAKYQEFTNFDQAVAALDSFGPTFVIKADGLAAGKGVTVTSNKDEAIAALKAALIENSFGNSGNKVLLEEFLPGKEASVFGICDGNRALLFQPARDYKRALDNDLGANTGGMGAVSPVEYIDSKLFAQIQTEIFDKAVAGFAKDGTPYKGLLYAGLMIYDGKARIVEFNCRFGDPETQALLPLLEDDLAPLLLQAASGRLYQDSLRFKAGVGLTVVIAANGYPGPYQKQIDLSRIDDSFNEGVHCFHAGTSRNNDSKLISSGGRIANVTATGATIDEARKKVYSQLSHRSIDGTFYRTDIGL